MPILLELSLVLIITTAVSFFMKAIRQPLVVGYILTGVLVGPTFLNLVHSHETLELFSKLGITILLFIVGLHLSPQVIKEVGKVSLASGLGQVLFTSVTGFLLALMLGIDKIAAIYVAIALTFSSTIIILKLLSDKGDIHALYGKIAIGFLLVQDIVASIILISVSSLAYAGSTPVYLTISLVMLKGAGMFMLLSALGKWVLPKITTYAASNSELLFLFSLTWGLGFALLFQVMNLSIEIGALIAGISLSTSEYAEEISSRLRSLRDFFIIVFFVLLGSQMIITFDHTILIPAFVFSAYVLIGNPIIMIIIMNLLGYHKKTGFMAGLTVAQISEFSLILATLGMSVGHLSQEVLTIVTLVGLITIAASSYMILYSEKIYPFLTNILTFFEFRKDHLNNSQSKKKIDAYIFGFNRVGKKFYQMFKEQGYTIGIVDFDPLAKQRVPRRRAQFFYGDAANIEFLNELQIDVARVIVSTIPDKEANMLLIKHLKMRNQNVIIVVFAHSAKDALSLYEAGAQSVILPHYVGAEYAASLIKELGNNHKRFQTKKNKHILELQALVSA